MLQLLAGGLISAVDLVAGASCIHPDCLDASLSRSLQVMNIETVGGHDYTSLCFASTCCPFRLCRALLLTLEGVPVEVHLCCALAA